MRRSLAVPMFLATLAVTAAGCSKDDEGERIPLGAARESATLSDLSRAALAEGNAEFRARRYDKALDAYRRAAAESPRDVAPLWGIQMTAKAMGNTALADSAIARMQALAPDAAPLAGKDPHAGIDTTGAALPPNHPSTAPVLPPNHPPASGSTTKAPVSGT